MKIYCLFDKKACEYSCVTVERNQAMFERSIAQQINLPKPNNLLYTNSADFDIYCLGEMDNGTGIIISDVKYIRNCSELKQEVN